ncbi:threonine--tRNA ligase [Candidatus Pacearchaeota archaeon]|nr:threonine--tRNA ligase [Candidatus Pacearchaeota archaeon]
MKILTLHCDYIKFKPLKKAIKNPEEIKDKEEKTIKEPLVILTAVEKGDNDQTVREMVEAVEKTANEVKTKTIVLYPYAHLSSKLSAPETALEYLTEAEHSLQKKGFQVTRAPFGYYKQFELKVKGHPLSELSKQFSLKDAEDVKGEHKVIELEKESEKETQEKDIPRLLKELSRSKLDTSKLKANDHRILGQKLDLFSFSESAPGSVFWHHNGLVIYKGIIEFERELLKKYDYQEISTPQILDNRLWKVSGHWQHYKNNMFLSDYENRSFGVKPMNCPGGMLVYRAGTKSYKDLPLRVAEFGAVHRKELSGVLAGLFRVIKFTQDDAHIFCAKEQLENEIKLMIEFVETVYKKFNFDYSIELSTRPEKFMGEIQDWDFSEKSLESALKKLKIKYKTNKGDGAFYGPKIDFHIKDSLGRNWQCGTIQMDMQMPQRFELKYTDKDNKEKTPIMIHRAICGSIERFIGVLLEHSNGALPVWLSPIQVRVINFTDRNLKASSEIAKKLEEEISNLRIDTDFSSTTVSDKVRQAEILRIPYIIVIGDKEEKTKTLAVRKRSEKPKFGVKINDFIKEISEKIEKRT